MSKRQFVFITACFVQGSFMYTMYYYQIVGREAWITLLAGILLSFLIVSIYGALYKSHFDEKSNSAKSLAEINTAVYGNNFGKVISLVYVASLVLSCSRMLREGGQFVAGNLLMGINWIYILIILVTLCAWTAYYGIKYFAAVGTFTSIFMYCFTILLFLLLLPYSEIYHLLPIGKQPLYTYIKGTFLCTSVPFSELIALLVIAHKIKGEKGSSLKKSFIYGILAGSPFLMLSVLRDTLVLGPLMKSFSYPGFEVIRLVNYNVFSNVESLYGIIVIFLMFFKSALHFLAISELLGHILKCKKNIWFYVAVSVGMTFVSWQLADSNILLTEKVLGFIPYILLAINVGVPIVTLIVIKIKKLAK